MSINCKTAEKIDYSKINLTKVELNSQLFKDLPVHLRTQVQEWHNFGKEPTSGLHKFFK